MTCHIGGQAVNKEAGESGVLWNYASVLSIPPEIKVPFIRDLDRWLTCNGPAWTVQRCKDIYTDFIRFSAGVPVVAKWVARHPDGRPRGPIGALYNFAARGKREKFSVITLLRSYTRLMADEPTPSQMEKFTTAVTAEDCPLPGELLDDVLATCRKIKKKMGFPLILDRPRPYWTYMPSPSKRVPSLDGRNYPENSAWMNQWGDIYLSKYGRTARWKFPDLFENVLGSWKASFGVSQGATLSPLVDCVGSIGLIQEPGYKLRSVANPNRVYQVALEPLGDALFNLLKLMPWDCTHDQRKAIPHLQAHLASDGIIHSVDLSSATDYFPLSLQAAVLREIIDESCHDSIGLFEFLSRAPWRLGKTTISWTKGQPLGLYPSFASFALTHGLLLLSLNGGRHDNAFFVLGDDVVIMDDTLYTKYINVLSTLNCPVSESKSLSSRLVCEFAGKIVTKEDVFPQPKWRLLSDDNFLDILRLLGGRALLLCRPRQRKIAKAMWEIPEFLGGLGFNPHGVPLEVRYSRYLELFGDNDRGEYLMSFDRHLNQFFCGSEMASEVQPLAEWKGEYRTPAFDLKAIALAHKYLPHLVRWFKVLGANLYTLSPTGGDLPQVGVWDKRQTLLALLERKLGL